MLIISKPTQFGHDGLAVRGQCSHDSPGWQLRWFERGEAIPVIWQGAFKTCRHLQSECSDAESAEEASRMVDDLLNSNAFNHFSSMPTDIYPIAKGDDLTPGQTTERGLGLNKKRRKRKKK